MYPIRHGSKLEKNRGPVLDRCKNNILKYMHAPKTANAHMRYYHIKILKKHDSDNFSFNLFFLITLLFMKSERRMTTVNELNN